MNDDFMDSNILIYANSRSDPRKRAIARELVQLALDEGGVISFQVVQETLNVLTRKLPSPVSLGDAGELLRGVLEPLWNVMPTPALYQRALDLQDRYGYSFYDSLIIAAALTAGCTRLYSEDLHDGQQIEGLTIVNPFSQ